MKTAIATLTVGLLVLGGLAWAQMGAGKQDGMTQQQSAADVAKAEAAQEASKRPMHDSGGMMGSGMMGNMMGKMGHMMKPMMGAGAQDDLPLIRRLVQQREQLGLSAAQVQQLQTLANEARKALIRHNAEVQVTEMEIEALMQAEPVDLAQVEDTVKGLESRRAEMLLARLNAIAKSRAILTPEQRQQLSTQTATASQDMPGGMGCPMMNGMMGHRSDT